MCIIQTVLIRSQPGGGYDSNTEYNPLALAVEPIRDFISTQFICNPSIKYKIIKRLKINTMISCNLIDGDNNIHYSEKITNTGSTARTASITNDRYGSFQNTNIINY